MADTKRKSMYREPTVVVVRYSQKDIIATSGEGEMSWKETGGGWDDFTPNRDNTFLG